MILQGFKTTNQDNLMYSAANLYALKYPGDQRRGKFWNLWLEILDNIAMKIANPRRL